MNVNAKPVVTIVADCSSERQCDTLFDSDGAGFKRRRIMHVNL